MTPFHISGSISTRRQDGRHLTFSEWFSASECASLVESSSHKIQDQVSDSATYGLDMDCARLLSLVSAPHARFSLWERLSFYDCFLRWSCAPMMRGSLSLNYSSWNATRGSGPDKNRTMVIASPTVLATCVLSDPALRTILRLWAFFGPRIKKVANWKSPANRLRRSLSSMGPC